METAVEVAKMQIEGMSAKETFAVVKARLEADASTLAGHLGEGAKTAFAPNPEPVRVSELLDEHLTAAMMTPAPERDSKQICCLLDEHQRVCCLNPSAVIPEKFRGAFSAF